MTSIATQRQAEAVERLTALGLDPQHWLSHRQPALGGRVPIGMLSESPAEAAQVLDVLRGMEPARN